MPVNNLIRANIGAASLHGLLLVALVAYYFINNPDKTSVFLFDESWDLSNETERCECWAAQGYFTTNSEINLLTMTLVFTIITFIAHVFYASNISNVYLSAIDSGKNPYRWIEYGASASIMLGILSILAGNRNRNLFILTIVATFAQMLQGYSIESAVANGGSAVDRLVPLVAGWALLAGAWYAVYHKWYDGMAQAFDNYDYCKENKDDFDAGGGKPPEFISHLINVVFVMFASFGVVNLAYVVNSFIGDAKSNFKTYELAYISLSFIAKAILIIWCMSSIFNGELEWLKDPGSLDVLDVKQPPLTNEEMSSYQVTKNGKTWVFESSSSNGGAFLHRNGFQHNNFMWQSQLGGGSVSAYTTQVDSTSFYDYAGGATEGAYKIDASGENLYGEWLQIKLPDPVLMTSFAISGALSENLPRSFKILGSEAGTSWDVLGEYTDVTVATTDEGTNLNLGPLATSSNNYYYYAILITRIEKIKQDANNVAIRWLRYYSSPNSCVSFNSE